MMKISVQIGGLSECLARFRELEGKLSGEVLTQAAEEGIAPIAGEALRRCPIRTGRLRGSIRVRRGRREVFRGRANVGPRGVFYAGFVEFGTKKRGPRPFMRPALDARAREAVIRVADSLRRIIR
jgi:HK97 gp10 family phage protein